MNVALLQCHLELVAQWSSQLFVRDVALLFAIFAILLRCVPSRYNQRAFAAYVTLSLLSLRSGLFLVWFKRSSEFGFIILESRNNSVEDLVNHERFHFMQLKNEELSNILSSLIT